MDPRPGAQDSDPVEWHRHRIHPLLWQALIDAPSEDAHDPVNRELSAWHANQKLYLARRPVWSQLKDAVPPWA